MPRSYEELRAIAAAEAQAKPRNRVAVAALVLGVLSFVGGVTALPGLILGLMGLNRAKRTGTGHGLATAGVMLSLVGIPVGLASADWLLRFVVHRGPPPVAAKDDSEFREESANNLRRIGIALQNFDAAKGALPLGANCDDDDDAMPLLSWRVAILPQLGYQELYDQFNHDEPWDSPANKALIPQMPEVFADPRRPNDRDKGETRYKVFVGEKAVFSHAPRPGDTKVDTDNLSVWSINDLFESPRGKANVALVVEGGEVVPWTKPADLPYAEGEPLPNVKSPYADHLMVLMADGRVLNVRFRDPDFEAALRESIDPSTTSPLTLDR